MADITKVKEETRGDRKVVVFVDECSEVPAQNWDMTAAFYAGQYWDNTKQDLGDSIRSAREALEYLFENVSPETLVECIKKGRVDGLRIQAIDGQDLICRENGVIIMAVKELDEYSELTDYMLDREMMDIIMEDNPDVVLQMHRFTGYNEWLECLCYTDRTRWIHNGNVACEGWQEKANEYMKGDAAVMDKWFRGEVYGFKEYALVKKHVTCEWPEWAKNCDGYAEEEDIKEWEETDSLWCLYDDPDKIIEDVFNDNI